MQKKICLTKVSRRSPYVGCTIGDPGTNILNAEVEPLIDINPTTIGNKKSANLIGVWQQDRWSNGSARGLVAGYSFDGGKTWETTMLPFSACAPGGFLFERTTDPWVSFGPDGTAYTSALVTDARKNEDFPINAIAAATSTDGGRTWNNLNLIKFDHDPKVFNDKEAVTADPLDPGVAYIVWDRLDRSTTFIGPTWFSRTTDGGRTWSTPKIIFFPGENNQTIGNQIVIDPLTGVLYNFFDWIIERDNQKRYYVAFQKSFDRGTTWTSGKIIAQLNTVSVKDPVTGAPIRTGNTSPQPAIDPTTGVLYVVWQDSRFNGSKYDEIALSYSNDGGDTWSEPARVNTPTGQPAFTPSIDVNSVGVVAVSYYDFRNLTRESSILPTDYWLAVLPAGEKRSKREFHLAHSFNMRTAPFARGFFLGDYQGLTSIGTAFQPFFVKTNFKDIHNITDVFTTTVEI